MHGIEAYGGMTRMGPIASLKTKVIVSGFSVGGIDPKNHKLRPYRPSNRILTMYSTYASCDFFDICYRQSDVVPAPRIRTARLSHLCADKLIRSLLEQIGYLEE